ncbi:MAG: glycosyltransferase family 2 protein [Actinomycetota bacterium]|nr:glycosyltransferase family 2 protein [Actinomycetota bacterium]
MKLVMTLLVRDEADIVDEQIAFHLDAGVDFVIATDNRSQDGTIEILERYASAGRLHLIREPGEDLRQSEWVTRMARLAATEFGADWVLNTDADEFWWPQGAGLKELLAVVPARYGVVRAAWRNFVPRPDDGHPFFERMTARLCAPAFHHHPLSTHSKSAHRAVDDVRVGRGNHEAFGEGLLPLRGWYPLEILHFPVRSLEHSVRKYVTQFVALEKNAEKGIPNHMAEAHEAYRAGRLEKFYEPLVVGHDALARGLRDGSLAVDTRLRDQLHRLGFGSADPSAAGDNASNSLLQGAHRDFGRLDVSEAAQYAAESSVLDESDFALALGARVEELETRVGRLERGALTRVGRVLRRGLRS